MIYFIFWVVFLLVVILSVPVVSFLEKRKREAARRPVDAESEELADAESEEVDAEVGDADFAAVDEVSADGDEFAEFEEIR